MDTLKRVAAVVIASALLIGGAVVLVRQDDGGDPGNVLAQGDGPAWLQRSCTVPLRILERIERGTRAGRSPDISFLPRFPNYFGSFTVSTHSGPWDYLQEVPLVLFGPGYVEAQGELTLDRPVTTADLAPTLAELLGTELPGERDGTSITEALVPPEERTTPPRLVVLLVWDGGGSNVLERWPSAWPFLSSLIENGTAVQGSTVGSSPSVTPAIHSTMGTGAFPARHGVVDIPIRNGTRVPDAFPDKAAKFLDVDTLADVYDQSVGNQAKVGMIAERGWHLGMMGHGALLPGGDRDIAVMSQGGDGELTTNELYYRLPSYLRDVPGFAQDIITVDESDGSRDGAWMGHPIPTEHKAGAANPVWTLYQERLLERLVDRGGFGADETPDLLFTNVKEIDLVGHVYNMVNPEMRSAVRHADRMLKKFVAFLEATVGQNQYVIAMTADHGSGPDPRTIDAWPIGMPQLQVDLAARFGVRVTKLFQAQRPTGMWFHPGTLERKNIDLEDVAEFLLDYRMEDNLAPGKSLPPAYRARSRERLFAAAYPSASLPEVMSCARAKA